MLEVGQKYSMSIGNDGKLCDSIYFGDDIPDLEGMLIADISGCPNDAAAEIKDISELYMY